MTEKRKKALDFATKAFEGVTRKFGDKEPYINHCIRVADGAVQILVDSGEWYDDKYLDEVWCIGVLHDTIEDIEGVTRETLETEFGFQIAHGVWILTKREGETYLDAVLRAKSWRPSKWVKMADNEDNMRDLKEGSLKDKYRLSHYILSH